MLYNMLPNEPIDLGFSNVIEDCCDYIDLDNKTTELCNRNGLNILQFNTRGILGKQDLLKTFLKEVTKECKLQVIMLVETWLKKTNCKRLKIPGYVFVGSHRKCKKGGGVGFLVCQDLDFRERPDLCLNIPNFEGMMIELKTHKDSIFLCTIYRPPNSSENEFLKNYKRQLKKLNSQQLSRLIIGLDHNLDLLKHDKHKPTHEFIEMNLEHQLIPTITKPTRITRSTATLIDNILVGTEFQTNNEPSIILSDISDHYPCLLSVNDESLFKRSPKQIQTRKLDPNKIEKISQKMVGIQWEHELENLCLDDQYNFFHSRLIHIMDEEAPYQTVTIPYSKIIRDPWLTPGLMKSLTKQRSLYKTSISKHSDDRDMVRYKTYRNKLKEIIRRSKEAYYKGKCMEFKHNTQRLWKLINKLTNKSNDKTNIVARAQKLVLDDVIG